MAPLRRVSVHAAVLALAFGAGQLAGLIDDGRLVPLSVQILAVTAGCSTALFAVGLVLIYRASRIINFAHAGLGGVGAVVMLMLIRQYGVPYYFAAVLGLASAMLLGLVVELVFVRRFTKAPRLVLTVLTIAIGQVLGAVAGALIPLAVSYFTVTDLDEVVNQSFGREDSPLSRFAIDWFPVSFSGDHLALVAVTAAVLVGMAAFLRYSSAGVAVRAAAENSDKAALLGINTRTLSSLVWVLAALLSGVAAISQVPLGGVTPGGTAAVGSAFLLRALAAAVLARMESIPLAVTGAIGLTVFEQTVFHTTGRTEFADIVVLGVILGGLLLQRKRIARADESETSTWAATEEIRAVPRELAGVPAVRRGARWVALVGGTLILAYPWLAAPAQVNLGSLFLLYGIVAISLVILTGWGGQISLGHFALVAVGAIVAGGLSGPLPFGGALLAGSLAGAGVAVLLGVPALRIRGLFLAVTTLAFTAVTVSVLLNPRYFGWLLPGAVDRPTFAFIDTEDARSFYYLSLLALAFAAFVARGLRRSRTGRVLIAMRDNERAAQSFSVNLVRTRLITFAISGFLAAFAGSLFAYHQYGVAAESFAPDRSLQMFHMAVIGGLGSVTGVLLGPLYIGLSEVVLPNEFQILAGPLGVLAVLLFFPSGLGGVVYGARDAFLRRVAIRNRIFVPSLLADYRADAAMTKVPLAPKFDPDGNEVEVPVHYELPSRVGVAGASQAARTWGN